MPAIQKIAPCLWFDDQAEEAVNFYTTLFPNSKVGGVMRYSEVGREFHGREPGSAMSLEFELDGQAFTALNGGPHFKFSEAISFQVYCKDQAEVDYYWDKLSEGGDPAAQQCGWLKDKFGLSWQVVPTAWFAMLEGADPAGVERATAAMFQMKKLDIAALQKAYDG
ncbi:MAG: VOC family protein [Anaerolineae bacterium]|nr:VOC family protein [Anaerolineae bacterium]